jgi:putative ABC transport system substrate-binding protein
MRRREIIIAIGGAAVGWPLVARAQRAERMRHIAVILGGLTPDNKAGHEEVAGFEDGLKQAGWNIGGDLEIDYRWPGAVPERVRATAKEIADAHPDVVLTRSTPATAALVNTGLPVVFTLVADPLGSGFINSFAKPGGNLTGFSNIETSSGGKLLALLKEIAPALTRIALLFNPETAPYFAVYLRSASQAAQILDVELKPTPVANVSEIETVLAALAGQSSGFVVIPDITLAQHSDLLIALAARHRLPAIYSTEAYVPNGGLMSYATDYVDIMRRAASYVDLVLRGTKPADLPVQIPTRFQLAINLKTAKALGLKVPLTLQASADMVVE